MAGAAAADPLRAGAFRVGLVLIFLYFSMLHQIQAYLMKVNLHLLYFAAVPALLGVLMSGGFARSYRGRAAYYWTGYILWMMVCVPFSSWRSGSLQHVMDYLRTVIPMLFVMSGLIVTWRECKAVMSAIAFGGLVNLASSRMFQAENRFGERLGLQFSSIADSNDFAAHLLMVLPFVLWMALNGRNSCWKPSSEMTTCVFCVAGGRLSKFPTSPPFHEPSMSLLARNCRSSYMRH